MLTPNFGVYLIIGVKNTFINVEICSQKCCWTFSLSMSLALLPPFFPLGRKLVKHFSNCNLKEVEEIPNIHESVLHTWSFTQWVVHLSWIWWHKGKCLVSLEASVSRFLGRGCGYHLRVTKCFWLSALCEHGRRVLFDPFTVRWGNRICFYK